MEPSSDDRSSNAEDLIAERTLDQASRNEDYDDAPSNAELWRYMKMKSEMQQRQMIMIERLQDVTDEIKAKLRAARLKPSSPASNTKSQTEDSDKAQSSSVSPSEQLRVTLRDSGNFNEFKTPAALRKVDVDDKPERKKAPRRESEIITSLRYNVTEAESVQVVNLKTAGSDSKSLFVVVHQVE